MLFHSYQFIFGFLPICFLVFVMAVHRWGWQSGVVTLGIASIIFYGQWSIELAVLLCASIFANYGIALLIAKFRDRKPLGSTIFLSGICANLCFLGYFKYTNFFIDNINAVGSLGIPHLHILLPVGISFYTFIQIGYLLELYAGQAKMVKFSHYFLFSSFFPCVTAGPLLLQREMMPQFAEQKEDVLDKLRIAIALTVITIGLFKKLVLADNIAPYANLVFDGVADGGAVSMMTAWIGALAYTLQLYFDFSGYSDMALGIGYLFGFRLPLNFNSPLKATSIIDFWRRWHMTMTRFFTNFVYTPLGVSLMRRSVKARYGQWKRFAVAVAMPITLTMVLAGIWHGAGWTFIIFGLLHGIALAANHAWRQTNLVTLPAPVAWVATMAVVVVGMVIFRAPELSVATTMLASMVGLSGLGAVAGSAAGLEMVTVDAASAIALIVGFGAIVLLFPNAQEIMRNHVISSDGEANANASAKLFMTWKASPAWAVVTVLLVVASLGLISGETTFLYYQF